MKTDRTVRQGNAIFRTVVLLVLLGGAIWGIIAVANNKPPVASTWQDRTIRGAGSTFANPMYLEWFEEYRQVVPDIKFTYASTGSGDGIRQMIMGKVDFGGTDAPMLLDEMDEFRGKQGCRVIHLPMALGAVVPTYNLAGVSQELQFTGEVLSGIYLGTITKWNDPLLAKSNPGVTLPNAAIVVVHRSDGSGTTYVWTDYLSKVNAEWRTRIGVNVRLTWPVGQGGEGNPGVAAVVKATPNAIGYVELGYAVRRNLACGLVQNQTGKFVKADLASVTAAAAGSARRIQGDDFRISITNSPGEGVYPISSFTWALVPERIQDDAKAKAMTDFLRWAVTRGQDLLEPLHYARLPKEVIELESRAIDAIHK